jgi:DNA-directed RNA polymerase subunit RPC12/RpoP
MADTETRYRCAECGWVGRRDQHGRNPRLGYLRCPRCERRGLDVLTEEIKAGATEESTP